ncbi:MAG: M12 family metallopeptidase [Bdellovibrionales bacterium]|nr:M12 family metallopeptidase [Bdellovibrionales bacterium]
MKTRYYFLILVVLAVGFWLYKRQFPLVDPITLAHHEEEAIPKKIVEKTKLKARTKISKKPVPAVTAPSSSLAKAEPKSSPPPKTIEFVLDEEGNAIAFGDVILGRPTVELKEKGGVAAPPKVKLWETLDIPYHIVEPFPHPERVQEAFEYFNDTTIRFVPFNGQQDAIVFQAKEGKCKSYLGRVGGHQPIWLSDNCYAPEIAHEIMHALGFIHEHSRTDRDQYIDVLWDNIEELYKTQFAIVPESLMSFHKGMPFDYNSIMIYRPDSFAKRGGLSTLKSKTNIAVAPVMGLSKIDIERVNRVYTAHAP